MGSLLVGIMALTGSALMLSQRGATVAQAVALGAVLYGVGTVGIKIARALTYPFYFSKLRHIPGPTDNQFLVGQGLRLLSTPGPNDLYLEWMRRWPDEPFIRHLNWGNSEALLVNSLEACHEILQTNVYQFGKPAFFAKLVGEILGVGMLFSVGDQHRRLRRLMGGSLSKSNIRKLLPIFNEKSEELSATLEAAIGGNDEAVVEIESLFSKTAFKVIGVYLLGKDVSDFTSKSSPLSFEECYKGILNPPTLGKLITFINPFIPLRWLPIRANLDFIKANTALRAMITDLIQERVEEIQREKKSGNVGGKEKKDMLSRMILANLAEEQKITDVELVDTCIQSVSAGHETTAGALTWTTYALVTYPSMQERLRSEIMSAMSSKPELDAATIDNLPFLNNLVNESLRVYSPTLMVHWETASDMVIAGVPIPKGTTVTTIPAMVHLNPKIWGEDAEVFNPDRWDNLPPEAANPFALEAFLNGPRTCPGKELALLEIKAILVELISKFKLEAVDTELKFERPTLTLKPKGGLRICVSQLR